MVDGAKIKSLRESLNVTQKELGEEIGITQTAIHYIESGLKEPKILTLARIAKRLGCTVDELIIING